ncbi:MAG: LptF/LptG family permease [Puniceicoccales bacterium]|jgi:lipopolysaccharide export system permease protein|nr:LptF/LptG family permease [Puniceicoccales bacterium]
MISLADGRTSPFLPSVRVIQSYVLREGLLHSSLSVALFALVLLSGNAIRDVLELLADGKISLFCSLKFLCILSPSLISYALPLGILTGTLWTLGKMASRNEILLIKSAGISLFQILSPLILIALGAMLLSLFINFEYAPKSIAGYRRSLREMVREDPLRYFRPATFVREFPGYILFAQRRQESCLEDFHVWELDSQGRTMATAQAESAEVSYDPNQDTLLLSLHRGSAEKRPDDAPENIVERSTPTLFFKCMDLQLPLGNLLAHCGPGQVRLKHMSLGELLRARREAIQRGDFAGRVAIQLQIQKQIVMALATLSMVLLGAPLAMKSAHAEIFIHLFLAILLAMGFYFSVIAISWLEDFPHWRPDLLLWIPNLLLQVLGFILFRRTARH